MPELDLSEFESEESSLNFDDFSEFETEENSSGFDDFSEFESPEQGEITASAETAPQEMQAKTGFASLGDAYDAWQAGKITEKDLQKISNQVDPPPIDLISETIKFSAKWKLGGAAAQKLLSSPLAGRVLSKVASIPAVGKIISSMLSGGVGVGTFTAATDLPELLNQEITPEEYRANIYSGAKIGSVIGGGLGVVQSGGDVVHSIKASKLIKAWQKAPVRTPLKPLNLTPKSVNQVMNETSTFKKGEAMKHQLWLRGVSEKPLDVEDAKVLNKLLVGKPVVQLSQKDAFIANRKLEALINNGEFYPALLRSNKGVKQLAKKISKIDKWVLQDPSAANIDNMTAGLVPGYAQAERYGFGELTRSVDAAKVKTTVQVGKMGKSYDKIYQKIKPTYAKSSKKIVIALEPGTWGVSYKGQQGIIKNMTKEEQHAYRFYKKRLDFYKARLKKAGKPVRERGYFTHIRERIEKHSRENPTDSTSIESIKSIDSNFSKARIADTKGFDLDVDKVLRKYEQSMIGTYNDAKVLKQVKRFMKTHDITKSNEKYLNRVIKEDILGRNEAEVNSINKWKDTVDQLPGPVQKIIKKLGLGTTNPLTSAAKLLVKGIARAKLGTGNWKFLIRNFTTQRFYGDMFTSSKAGVMAEWMMKAKPREATALLSKSRVLNIYNKLSGQSLSGLGLEDEAFRLSSSSGTARKMGIGLKRGAKGAAEFLGRLGYFPVTASAKRNAARAYLQGYTHAKHLGLGEMAARHAGDYVAETTQYVYTYTNKLGFFRGPAGRLYGLFGSWAPNHFQMVRRAMGTKPFIKWALNVGTTSLIADKLGEIDPYYKSANIFSIHGKAPIFEEALLVMPHMYEDLMESVTTMSPEPLQRSVKELSRLLKPPRDSGVDLGLTKLGLDFYK